MLNTDKVGECKSITPSVIAFFEQLSSPRQNSLVIPSVFAPDISQQDLLLVLAGGRPDFAFLTVSISYWD